MKKYVSILLSVLLLLTMLSLGVLSVAAETYGGLTYKIVDGAVTITDCDTSTSGSLVIPATIDGYPVTSIGDTAFLGCEALTSVIIPDSVTTIGWNAFQDCARLSAVTIGNRVSSFGWSVFAGCASLTDVYYRGSEIERQYIGGLSNYNSDLTNATWHYEPGITGDCTWTLVDGHLTISGNGAMKDYRDDFSNTAPWGADLTSVTIEDGVTSIGNNAFHYCRSITSVSIGNSVTTIGGNAFRYCNKLEVVTIPDSVTVIDEYAFSWCTALTTVNIGVGPIRFYEGAFNGCSALTDVYYAGSEADRKVDIYCGTWNSYFTDATWHYAKQSPLYSDTVQHSVMDTENGNGLAFRFDLTANGVATKNGNVVDLTNATVAYLGNDCKLVGMGAMLTNDDTVGSGKFTLEDVNGNNVIDVPTVYMQDVGDDICAFATRIINIPDTQLERVIYARPYYIVEVEGEQITVYGEIDSASCAEYM